MKSIACPHNYIIHEQPGLIDEFISESFLLQHEQIHAGVIGDNKCLFIIANEEDMSVNL
jgi:hypothetical protein